MVAPQLLCVTSPPFQHPCSGGGGAGGWTDSSRASRPWGPRTGAAAETAARAALSTATRKAVEAQPLQRRWRCESATASARWRPSTTRGRPASPPTSAPCTTLQPQHPCQRTRRLPRGPVTPACPLRRGPLWAVEDPIDADPPPSAPRCRPLSVLLCDDPRPSRRDARARASL